MVMDQLSNPGCDPKPPTYTYNQGVILAGLTQLYRATGNSSLLRAAQGIANAAILNLNLNGSGVLNEAGTACGHDIQSFKGTYARGLKELSNSLGTEWYASFFENQVNSIIPVDTNSSNQMGFRWQGPVSTPGCFNNGITSYSQASAEDALVAGLSLGHNGTALAGIASFCLDDHGSGTTSGTQIDIWKCNSTPAQSWSTPAPGKTGEMRVLGGCATVNGSKAKRTKVVWDRCTGSAQQEWTRHTGTGSILSNAWSGLCMDNSGNSGTNGNPVQIFTCNNSQAQFWGLP